MATPHKATPEQWGQCEADAATWGRAFPCILELRSRIEALEAAASAPADHFADAPEMVATDEELCEIWDEPSKLEDSLRAVYNLGRQHGAAQAANSTPEQSPAAPAPAGGLVERVAKIVANGGDPADWQGEARAAILAVADWFTSKEWHVTAVALRVEVQRHG